VCQVDRSGKGPAGQAGHEVQGAINGECARRPGKSACPACDDLLFPNGQDGESFRHNLPSSSGEDLVTVSRRPGLGSDTLACCLVDVDVRNVRESTELGAIARTNQVMVGGVQRFFRLQVALEG
jgi:hypothetical protein